MPMNTYTPGYVSHVLKYARGGIYADPFEASVLSIDEEYLQYALRTIPMLRYKRLHLSVFDFLSIIDCIVFPVSVLFTSSSAFAFPIVPKVILPILKPE